MSEEVLPEIPNESLPNTSSMYEQLRQTS
jgi:hypothetical protein